MATTRKTARRSSATKKTPAGRSPGRRALPKKRIGKMVYFFAPGATEGKASQKALLGGKGANLADMTSIGLPVPPGFTITTTAPTSRRL